MNLTFEEWANWGWEQGWCSPPVCVTHDGLPLSENEEEELLDGEDNCVHIIRLYEDSQTASEIVEANPELRWRATNRGWGK